MEPWHTSLVSAEATSLRIRGYDIAALMQKRGFAATVFLLHRGRLPTAGEERLLNGVLVASADHGAGAPSCAAARLVASGNRQSLSAAVAGGILTIGDAHGGAGAACMTMIASVIARARDLDLTIQEAADRLVDESRSAGRRVPGLGHRVHTVDPRVDVLFSMARDAGIAGDGVAAMQALEVAVRSRVKPMPTNVDGALGAVLFDMGFPPEAGMLLFIVGRVAGLTAEVAEEYAREKPMRIKFAVQYDGEPPRELE
jgi:citrate synthase